MARKPKALTFPPDDQIILGRITARIPKSFDQHLDRIASSGGGGIRKQRLLTIAIGIYLRDVHGLEDPFTPPGT